MSAIMFMIVMLCGLGVWLDADRYKITSSDKVTWYQGGPASWGLGTMLLWIVIFPTYMLARKRLIASAAQRSIETPAIPSAPRSASSVADELTKLADLHDRGALSDTEFEAHKAALRPPTDPAA